MLTIDSPPSFVNAAGITGLLTFAACVLIVVIGLGILAGSRRANFSKTAKTSGNAIIGIIFIVIGLGAGLAIGLGTSVYQTVAK
jgi:threonine/homoserine/homoserine lactone efflux protein